MHRPRLLFIDNYDSFSYNIVNALASSGARVHVRQANECAALSRPLHYDGVVVGPGPGTPLNNAPLMHVTAQSLESGVPVLGICLGMQAMAASYGAGVVCAPRPVHGEICEIHHGGDGLFAGLPSPLRGARYHSLCVDRATLPLRLRICASSEDGVVQAIQHRNRPLFGVQFHPESFLSERGDALLENFVRRAGGASC